MTFADLGLGPELLRAIGDVGYKEPTPIQAQAIPVVLMGRDVLGCAQTGTGKTASFTLPMIEILAAGRARARMPRSLILEPTRELAAQVAENFELYGKYHKLSMALLIGGESFADQEKRLDRGVDVLIATPGRLLDLFERGKILMTDVRILVIDEADRMLDMGFINDVRRIAKTTHPARQTALFSATMPKEIEALASSLLRDPVRIEVSPQGTTAAEIRQHVVMARLKQKRQVLADLLSTDAMRQVIVFARTKHGADRVTRDLVRDGFEAAVIHGNKSQNARQRALDSFREGAVRILVATDIAARGIDVPGISHVVNFDLPDEAESYVHRIGRTGRNGAAGEAITLCDPSEAAKLRQVERVIRMRLPVLRDITGEPDPVPRRPVSAGSDAEAAPAPARKAKARKGQQAASKPPRRGSNRRRRQWGSSRRAGSQAA